MVTAVQHVRRMRGGSQSHLMRASDGNLYVVKFENNPQGVRVLANELIVTRLAETAGLSVPACEIIEVNDWIIQNSLTNGITNKILFFLMYFHLKLLICYEDCGTQCQLLLVRRESCI